MRCPGGGPLPMTVVVFDHSAGDRVCSECDFSSTEAFSPSFRSLTASPPIVLGVFQC
ncbi:hypothetical protein ACSBR1_007638 [Camellia fascicularis]